MKKLYLSLIMLGTLLFSSCGVEAQVSSGYYYDYGNNFTIIYRNYEPYYRIWDELNSLWIYRLVPIDRRPFIRPMPIHNYTQGFNWHRPPMNGGNFRPPMARPQDSHHRPPMNHNGGGQQRPNNDGHVGGGNHGGSNGHGGGNHGHGGRR